MNEATLSMILIPCDPSRRSGFLLGIDWLDGADFPALTWENFVGNLVPVTIGKMIGGSIMVAAVYLQRERRFSETKPRAAPCLND
jgi:formate/nitrite transporter FocA (FNT family)